MKQGRRFIVCVMTKLVLLGLLGCSQSPTSTSIENAAEPTDTRMPVAMLESPVSEGEPVNVPDLDPLIGFWVYPENLLDQAAENPSELKAGDNRFIGFLSNGMAVAAAAAQRDSVFAEGQSVFAGRYRRIDESTVQVTMPIPNSNSIYISTISVEKLDENSLSLVVDGKQWPVLSRISDHERLEENLPGLWQAGDNLYATTEFANSGEVRPGFVEGLFWTVGSNILLQYQTLPDGTIVPRGADLITKISDRDLEMVEFWATGNSYGFSYWKRSGNRNITEDIVGEWIDSESGPHDYRRTFEFTSDGEMHGFHEVLDYEVLSDTTITAGGLLYFVLFESRDEITLIEQDSPIWQLTRVK